MQELVQLANPAHLRKNTMSTHDTMPRFIEKAMEQAALRSLPNSCGQRARKAFAARALQAMRKHGVIDLEEKVLSYMRYAGLALVATEAVLKAREYVLWEVDMAADGHGRFYPKQTRAVVQKVLGKM